MESLNLYASDSDSDSSSTAVVPKKSAGKEEIDANCEPITMEMSEDSSNEHSAEKSTEENNETNERRRYSKSLSPSPATSYSSDSSENSRRKREVRENSKSESVKNRRYDERKRKYDRDYRPEDDDRDRRRRDKQTSKNVDRHSNRTYERKRYRSRSRSPSHSTRSRSPSHSKHKSYRRKNRSRSRSRSYDRYQRRNSPSKTSNSRRRSPYRSRRSRSRSTSRDKQRSKNWKSTSKLKVLEKLGIELKVPPIAADAAQSGGNSTSNDSCQLTPQMLLKKSMEEQIEKVKSATGIALPSYYNPMAVNPTKYAEQIQKRRLLWSNKDKQANNSAAEESKKVCPTDGKGPGTIWQGATFGGDQDGKMTAKFQRLMGIKNTSTGNAPELKGDGSDLIKKQEEMFNSMESQYEVARLATHTHRGVGLGFGTFQPR